jgi:hypothetical protein
LDGSVQRFAQVPLQSVKPVEQTHLPCEQTLPPVHWVPQEPQFAGSVLRSVQTIPQVTGQAGSTHLPSMQSVTPNVHFVPQAPQLLSSVSVLVQTPLQSVEPTGHTHWPLAHDLGLGQVLPQAPQL